MWGVGEREGEREGDCWLTFGAGFVDQHALILYVYLTNYEDSGAEESVLTVSVCPLFFLIRRADAGQYYISSYAA